MPYLGDGEFRYALFDLDLDHVKAERSRCQALFDVGTPAEVDGTFQGYPSLGDHRSMMVGNGYSTDKPPPPEGTVSAPGRSGNTRRGRARLYSGFATSSSPPLCEIESPPFLAVNQPSPRSRETGTEGSAARRIATGAGVAAR